jgi:hypothetical protein
VFFYFFGIGAPMPSAHILGCSDPDCIGVGGCRMPEGLRPITAGSTPMVAHFIARHDNGYETWASHPKSERCPDCVQGA